MKKSILLLISMLTVTIVFGQHIFTGSGDGSSWNDPNNWNSEVIPLTDGNTGAITIPAGFNVVISEDLTLNFTGNSLYGPGTISNQGAFIVAGTNSIKSFSDELTFYNEGVFQVGTGTNNAADFRVYNNSKLINTSLGTLIINGCNMTQTGGTSNIVFENDGVLQKIGNDHSIGVNMKNTGTIEVFDGELKLNPVNSYFEGGIYNVSEDAVLNLNGKHHLKGSLTGNIEGEFWFNNYYFIGDEGETASNDLEGNGILMINNTTISGPGSFVNNKLFTMNSDNSVKYFFEFLTFINNDILNVGDGNSSNTQLRIYDDSKLINSTDGTVIINGRDITQTGGTSNIVFENDGVLQKFGNDHSIGVNMKNTGTIEVFDGELKLNPVNSYFEGGVYNVSEDAVLNLNGQHHLKGSLTGNIEGEFWFNNYYFIVDEGDTASNDLEGNGILAINNTTISGPGNFVNNKLFTMNSDNSVKYFYEFLTFTNNDTLRVGNGDSSNTQFRIYNDSKLNNSADGTVIINGRDISQTGGTSNVVFENYGMTKKIGENDKNISAKMQNKGVLSVENGKLNLSSFMNAEDGLVEGIKYQFNSSNFENSGRFNPGIDIGKMTIDSYFSMEDGMLSFDIAGLTPETEHDVLEITATGNQLLNLSGDIEINLSYQAEIGDSFTVLTSGRTINADLPDYIISVFDYQYFHFEVIINDKNIVLEVVDIIPMCPDLLVAPDNVSVADSFCEMGCLLTAGEILAPVNACPDGSQLQYSTDNGETWSYDVPLYNQEEVITIVTRCECEEAPDVVSPVSAPVTTNPGECFLPQMPVITIVDNTCPLIDGNISAEDPGVGFSVEWSLDEENWSSETPEYTDAAITVYARLINDNTGCVSTTVEATTNPEDCSDYCSGTSQAGIVSVSPDQGKPNESYTVSSAGYSFGSGITYQWQSNTNGAGWINEGQESDTYFDFEATAPADYETQVQWLLIVTCEYSGMTTYSDVVNFVVNEEPGPSFDCEDLAVDFGDSCFDENGNEGIVDENCDCFVEPVIEPCLAPSGLSVSDITEDSAVISWEGDADAYQVYYTDGDLEWTENTTDTNIVVEVLLPNTTYLVSVISYCDDEAGEESDFVEFTTLDAQEPIFDCEDLAADFGDSCFDENGQEGIIDENCDCILIPDCELPYNPEASDSEVYISHIQLAGIGMDIGNDYYDFIYTSNQMSEGGYGEIEDPVLVVYPGLQSGYTVSSGPAGSTLPYHYSVWVDFNQNGCFEADEQIIFSQAGGVVNGSIGATQVPFTWEIFAPGTYQARIRNSLISHPLATGEGDGEALDFTIEVVSQADAEHLLGVESQEFINFSFHPNPVGELLNLRAGMPIEQVEIYNLLGQKVLQTQPQTLEAVLDTDRLQSGVYLMNVQINGSIKTFKVVRNKVFLNFLRFLRINSGVVI